MQAVATRVGVRAPSLYKRVRNRDELVALVAEATARELGERLDAAAAGAADARSRLMALARTFRGFAHERPVAFRLLFAPGSELAIDARGARAVERVDARGRGRARRAPTTRSTPRAR